MENIHILIAEDHKVFRQLLIPVLKEHVICTIGEAENGLELLALLETNIPDVILLDIEMPVMNGAEAFAQIRKLYPDVKVIFLSTHKEPVMVEYFYSKGAHAFLSKNSNLEFIIETIKLVHMCKYVPVFPIKNRPEEEFKFSAREAEIIPLIVEGRSNKEIADKLNIGNKAVEAHKKNLFKKTKTQSAVGFVSYILKKGFNYLK